MNIVMETLISDMNQKPNQLDNRSTTEADTVIFGETFNEVVERDIALRALQAAESDSGRTATLPELETSDNTGARVDDSEDRSHSQDEDNSEDDRARGGNDSQPGASKELQEGASPMVSSAQENLMRMMAEAGFTLSALQVEPNAQVSSFNPNTALVGGGAAPKLGMAHLGIDSTLDPFIQAFSGVEGLTPDGEQLADFEATLVNRLASQVGQDRPISLATPALSTGPGAAEATGARNTGTMNTVTVSAKDPQNFASSMATHLRVIKNQGGGEAKVNLHPAELGRMSVSVITEGSETRVAFTVETAQAKQAIESNLPRLREMLEQAGLSLADSDVAEQKHQSRADTDSEDRSPRAVEAVDTDEAAEPDLTLSVSLDPSRLLDTYV